MYVLVVIDFNIMAMFRQELASAAAQSTVSLIVIISDNFERMYSHVYFLETTPTLIRKGTPNYNH